MAVVSGIREKVHTPIYDCLRVEGTKQLRHEEKSSTLRFFVDVQGKTKLETNLQSSSLLPHYNTFEARAMRVVVSDLPPEYPEDDGPEVTVEDLVVTTDPGGGAPAVDNTVAGSSLTVTLARAMELLAQARESDDEETTLELGDDDVQLPAGYAPPAGASSVTLSLDEIQEAIDGLDDASPAPQQLSPDNGAGTILGKLIYNSVTTLYVGEKVMVEAPTWMFPAGAGTYSEAGKAMTHGEPNPLATFRFAEPIFIDRQQNFRVEIEIPHKDALDELQRIYGPLYIWVVLDGFMTRGVQ